MKGQKEKNQMAVRLPLVGLANELAQGEPIRIRYGTYPFGKRTFKINGKDQEFHVEQNFTRESAEAIKAAFANEMAKGTGKGIPIYFGHPDVPELAVKYPDKRAYGWVKSVTVDDTGMELIPVWNEEPGDHFSHFSPYWDGKIMLSLNGTAILNVTRIKSIGCVNTPNINEFALPNEEGETQTEEGTIMELAKLIALLGLGQDATEETVAAEITRLKTGAADAQTRLDAANAECEKNKTACANERTARIKLSLDHALASGQITPAMRPAWEKRLTRIFHTLSWFPRRGLGGGLAAPSTAGGAGEMSCAGRFPASRAWQALRLRCFTRAGDSPRQPHVSIATRPAIRLNAST